MVRVEAARELEVLDRRHEEDAGGDQRDEEPEEALAQEAVGAAGRDRRRRDHPARRKKSGMCQRLMKPQTIRKAKESSALRMWKNGAGLKTIPTWKKSSR